MSGGHHNVVDKEKYLICNFVKHCEVAMQPWSNTLKKHTGKTTKKALFHIGVKREEQYLNIEVVVG